MRKEILLKSNCKFIIAVVKLLWAHYSSAGLKDSYAAYVRKLNELLFTSTVMKASLLFYRDGFSPFQLLQNY